MEEIKKTSRSGRESYSSVKLWARREKRQQEAYARQEKYDLLNTQKKIDLVVKRGGSKRELDRLTKRLADEKKAPFVKIVKMMDAEPPKKKNYQRVKRS
jgi:hypothetical protein